MTEEVTHGITGLIAAAIASSIHWGVFAILRRRRNAAQAAKMESQAVSIREETQQAADVFNRQALQQIFEDWDRRLKSMMQEIETLRENDIKRHREFLHLQAEHAECKMESARLDGENKRLSLEVTELRTEVAALRKKRGG